MSSSGSTGSAKRAREALLREIAAGKRPATTPPPATGHEEDPDGPLTLLDQAIELSNYRRQVRQRLLADLNTPISIRTRRFPGLPESASRDPTGQNTTCLASWAAQRAQLHHTPCLGLECPRPSSRHCSMATGFGDNIRALLLPAVQLIGNTGVPYLVAVHDVRGRLYFTHGWDRFVLGEWIQPDDVGLFVIEGPNKMSLRVYVRSGLEKPYNARPVDIDPDLPPPVGANIHVPSHILGMAFELGPKVSMTSATTQTMANVWATRTCNNPLYVCTVIKSHMDKKCLYFGTKFSEMLPAADKLPAAVFFSHNRDVITGAITKSSHDALARLSSGFAALVKLYGIQIGDTLVVRMRKIEGGYRVRVFKVPA